MMNKNQKSTSHTKDLLLERWELFAPEEHVTLCISGDKWCRRERHSSKTSGEH